MLKTEGLGKKQIRIYETYKNTVMPHGRYIYAKAYGMEKATMRSYSQSDHALPHWKCVLRCYEQCLLINLPDQETYDKHPNNSPSISFHIYHLIASGTNHVRLPLSDKKKFESVNRILLQDNQKIYTIKELVVMETIISNLHKVFIFHKFRS